MHRTGTIRTDWAGRSLKQTPNRIADYAHTAGTRLEGTAGGSGNQPGDSARAALAMVRITEIKSPPRHLVLGAFGIDAVTTALKKRLAEVEQWRNMSLATDFPKIEAGPHSLVCMVAQAVSPALTDTSTHAEGAPAPVH